MTHYPCSISDSSMDNNEKQGLETTLRTKVSRNWWFRGIIQTKIRGPLLQHMYAQHSNNCCLELVTVGSQWLSASWSSAIFLLNSIGLIMAHMLSASVFNDGYATMKFFCYYRGHVNGGRNFLVHYDNNITLTIIWSLLLGKLHLATGAVCAMAEHVVQQPCQ